MRDGELTNDVHRAAAEIFAKHGFGLGHLSGHSIGITMIEYPAIGATSEALRENMIFSLHPQVVDPTAKSVSTRRTPTASVRTKAKISATSPGNSTTALSGRGKRAMKVCVVGCGAVGSIFAAHLARAGEAEVYAFDVSKEHVDAIAQGLRLSGAADFTAPARHDRRGIRSRLRLRYCRHQMHSYPRRHRTSRSSL